MAELVQRTARRGRGLRRPRPRPRRRRLGRRRPHGGAVRYSPFLDWRDVPLAELADRDHGVPVTVDNDVRALTVAEQWFGAGVGLSDFALVTVGAGIGCGLVVHGRVVSARTVWPARSGHLSVDPQGPPATAATAAVWRPSRGTPRSSAGSARPPAAEVADTAEAVALAHRGVPGAREVYARAGEAIGRAIATVANLLGPERVIISGEGLAAYDLFAEQIRDTFAAAAFGTAAALRRTDPPAALRGVGPRGRGHRDPVLHRPRRPTTEPLNQLPLEVRPMRSSSYSVMPARTLRAAVVLALAAGAVTVAPVAHAETTGTTTSTVSAAPAVAAKPYMGWSSWRHAVVQISRPEPRRRLQLPHRGERHQADRRPGRQTEEVRLRLRQHRRRRGGATTPGSPSTTSTAGRRPTRSASPAV